MSDFPLVELHSTSIQIIDGDRGVNYPKKKEFSEQGYCLFLDSSNLTKNGFDFSSKTFISKAVDERMGKGHLQRSDLVMNTRGTIGNIGLYSDNIPFESVRINSGMVIIRGGEDYDTRFLYLFLRSNMFFSQTKNLMSGSVQKQLPISVIKYVKLPKVDIPTQQKIAAVLSALDAKIELNQRINAELESMAKTLYDYWFIQFEFPTTPSALSGTSPKSDGRTSVGFGGGRRGYKSAGGKMVWNEALKREIPLGWEVDNILKVGDLLGGGTPKTNEPSYWDGDIPFYTPRDSADSIFVLTTLQNVTESGLQSCSSRLYPKGTIFITARGTVGNINVAAHDMAMNQSCYAIQPKPEINYYYAHQCCVNLVHYLKAKSNGSIFDAIVSNDIKLTPIVIPPLSLMQAYGQSTKGMYEKILVNKKESQTLTELRDWLLPMLMNGQVQVQT